jgi:CheY-like chemotaxis protein
VLADRQRLAQVLLNLLSNALKYNRPRGRVSIRCADGATGRFRISVTDTGFGIPEDKLRLLFQPFERLGQTEIEGTGLGLALSKGLAEAMGGTLGVETKMDEGSTFWIELAETHAPALVVTPLQLARPVPAADVAGTVLYIEDNAANVKLVERLLARRPRVQLMSASTGAEGLRRARAERPGLVLLDLHLPDMTGEDVLRQLWEDAATRLIPTIVLTADATPRQERRLLASGAKGYLTKPFDVGRVLETIDAMLKERHESA